MSDENGFLTDVDREFLQGEREYESKQGRYGRRQAIRERAREAFHDFTLLFEHLDADERERVFDPPDDEARAMRAGLADTIGFIYHALEGDAGERPLYTSDRSVTIPFDESFKRGIQKAERRRHGSEFRGIVTVDFDVDIVPIDDDSVNWGRIVEKLAQGQADDLTEVEVRVLLGQAMNDTERFRQLANEIEDERGRFSEHFSERHPADRYQEDELDDAFRSIQELVDEAGGHDESDE